MYLKRILLIFNFTVFTNLIYACTCFPLDSTTIDALLNEVEFVLIGHPKENLNFNREIRNNWNLENEGIEIIFKVDSVLKGNVPQNEVTINQFNEGNCTQVFQFGEQYLVLGNRINKFIDVSPPSRKSSHRDITISLPPLPPNLENGIMYSQTYKRKEIKYWNKLAKKNIVINTSDCSSYFLASQSANLIVKRIISSN